MIEFSKYLYAGGFALRTPYDYQKISQKWESQPNVCSCPANFTPVSYCGYWQILPKFSIHLTKSIPIMLNSGPIIS